MLGLATAMRMTYSCFLHVSTLSRKTNVSSSTEQSQRHQENDIAPAEIPLSTRDRPRHNLILADSERERELKRLYYVHATNVRAQKGTATFS